VSSNQEPRVANPKAINKALRLMKYHIGQVDLALDDCERANVSDAIATRWLTEGPYASEFRARLAELTQAKHVFFAPNGTLGLFLAGLALEAQPQDEIVIPTFTFYGSATAAHFAGFRPVFVDVDPETFNARPEAFEAAIGPRTKALMPVHIYGQACDMNGIMAVANRHGLRVIEDAAQALSVKLNGKAAGTFGDIGVYSLFSDKVITTGEGGVLVTDSDAIADRIRLLRNQGRPNSGTFVHPSMGMNFRITDMQAAVGLAQLRKLPSILSDRTKKWRQYSDGLAGVGDIKIMRVLAGSDIVPFRFPIVSAHRDRLVAALESAGIETRGFFYPMHLQPKFRCDVPLSLPVSEQLSAQGICLPVHVHLSDEQVLEIVGVIRRFFDA
jgi:perosamine synthetase